MPQGELSNWKQSYKSWFFGIGINTYREFPNLTNAVHDVRTLQSILIAQYDITEDHVITLFDEDATEENIFRKLDYLTRNVGTDDKLILYYSGHGKVNSRLNTGYWIPHDAKKTSSSRYILNSTVQDYIGGIEAKHILLISDSCFSGSIFMRGEYRSASAADELEEWKSRWALCSGRHDEEVYDGDPGGHSPFAQSLIEFLGNSDRDQITVSKVINHVIERTASNYNQLPDGRPMFGVGHAGGQYIFRKKTANFDHKQGEENTTKNNGEDLLTRGVSVQVNEGRNSESSTKKDPVGFMKWMAIIMIGVFTIVGAIILGGIYLVRDIPQQDENEEAVRMAETVDRDGKSYAVVELGGKTWLAEDLEIENENSWSNRVGPGKNLSRFYSLEGAIKACASLKGTWVLPSYKDWLDLSYSMGMLMKANEDVDGVYDMDPGLINRLTSPVEENLKLSFNGYYSIPSSAFEPDNSNEMSQGNYWTMEGGRIHIKTDGEQFYGELVRRKIFWDHAYSCRCVYKPDSQ